MNFSPVWLFDLDNTLHNADAGIFYIINRAMTDYMAQRLKLSEEAASDLRQDYWHRYGATLAGLQIPKSTSANFCAKAIPSRKSWQNCRAWREPKAF